MLPIKTTLRLMLAAAILSASACIMDAGDGPTDLGIEQQSDALTPGVPVRLLWAMTDSRCVKYTNMGTCQDDTSQAVLRGYIEVDNLAYQKDVVAHYQADGGAWKDAKASYAGTTSAGREAWYFETEPKLYSSRLGTEFPFALRYTVNGQTFWDNNGGINYKVGGGPRTFSPNLVLEQAVFSMHTFNGVGDAAAGVSHLYGGLAVKNLGYQKDIKARYTTDGWRTSKEVAATYTYSSAGYENWTLQLDVPGTKGTVEAALRYTVNGQTYWDNNYGRNYRVVVGAQ